MEQIVVNEPVRYRYFAYGSNMFKNQLEFRVGKVLKSGTAALENYELQFNCAADYFCSYANVVKKDGGRVHGVIYLLTKEQLSILDRYEGLYYKEDIRIDNKETYIYVSHMGLKDCEIAPTFQYLYYLLKGYKENNLEEGYNSLREKIYKYFNIHISI